VHRRRWHGPCPRGKSIRTRHTHAPTRAHANVAGRLAAAVIGLKINARAATIPLHAPPTHPARPRATATSVVRPYNYFRFISPSHAHTQTASASAAPHYTALHCTVHRWAAALHSSPVQASPVPHRRDPFLSAVARPICCRAVYARRRATTTTTIIIILLFV